MIEQIGCAILWLMPNYLHEFILWWKRLYLVQVQYSDGCVAYTWDSAEHGKLKDYNGTKFVYRLEVIEGCDC